RVGRGRLPEPADQPRRGAGVEGRDLNRCLICARVGAMKLLFVADPLEAFKTYKDTTFAMMREAARRGHELAACEPKDLVWERGTRVGARMRDIVLTGRANDWFEERGRPHRALSDVDV